MRKIILIFSIIISAFLLIGFSPAETNMSVNAASNTSYNTLYNSYNWSSFCIPSSSDSGTQTSDTIHWNSTDLAVLNMYTDSYTGSNSLSSGSVLNWKQVNIYSDVIYEVQDSNFYFHKSFALTKDGNIYYSKSWSSSDRTSKLLYSENLSEGDYTFTYVGIYTETAIAVITFTYVFNFTICQTPPSYVLKTGGNVITDASSYTNQLITYSALSPIFNGIYVKQPLSSSYAFNSNSLVTVENTSANGWYYFYAEDISGNVTPTVSIYLDTIPPNGSLYADGESISSGSTTNLSFNYMATDSVSGVDYLQYRPPASLTWKPYTSGAIIPKTAANGRYDFRSIDKCGNTTDVSTINLYVSEHNYYAKIVPPSCDDNGYTRHTCTHCEDFYDTDIVPALGHKFTTTTVFATCTENGGIKHICSVCELKFLSDIVLPSGHVYNSTVVKDATCENEGERHYVCENCESRYNEIIPRLGHNYIITNVIKEDKTTKREWTCTECGHSYMQNLGNQYEKVTSYVEYLINLYSPYMIWVFLTTAGVWSIVIGVMIILARKNEDKEKAKKMAVNYAIGLVVIFCILVACPFLIRGIAVLVS